MRPCPACAEIAWIDGETCAVCNNDRYVTLSVATEWILAQGKTPEEKGPKS